MQKGSNSDVEMPVPTSITQYRFTEEIVGQGTFSTVHKCICPKGNEVAVKCVRLSDMHGELHNLHREVQILQRVRHPHILTYLGSYHDPEHIYIVTELCPAGNLLDRILAGPIPESSMKKITRELVEGLKYLHDLHICHRDLKPENVLFNEKDEVKIADFGLARVLDRERVVSIVGTPYYLAPEVPDGRYDLKCDVWSLGVLVYYGLVGKLPFKGGNWEELRGNVLSSNIEDWGLISPDCKSFLLRLLEIDPCKRISSSVALQDKWLSACSS